MERYKKVAADLEDFWNRRRTETPFSREGHIFGHGIQLLANDPQMLDALTYSMPLFSRAPVLNQQPFRVQLVTSQERQEADPPPDTLFDHIWYTGAGDWLMLHLGPWGHAYVNLAHGEATAVLAPSLAARPDVISHSLLNTILLNFCLYQGYGMLHASCLVRDDRALLLMAPHNTGKSTTALHLIMAGYRLLTDSMVHVSPFHNTLLLCGFPVGRIKLRRDMLSSFPQLGTLLEEERVRDETKFTLDLRRVDPSLVVEQALAPARLDLCLLSRHDAPQTDVRPAVAEEVWDAALHNTLFYDQEAVWKRNLAQIEPLIEDAQKHRLIIGQDPTDIARAVDEIWVS